MHNKHTQQHTTTSHVPCMLADTASTCRLCAHARRYARIVARRIQRAKHGIPARLPNGERVKVKYASRQQHAYRRGRGAGGQFLKKVRIKCGVV